MLIIIISLRIPLLNLSRLNHFLTFEWNWAYLISQILLKYDLLRALYIVCFNFPWNFIHIWMHHSSIHKRGNIVPFSLFGSKHFTFACCQCSKCLIYLIYDLFMNVHFQKFQLVYVKLYAYSDFMLFFFYTWNMFLVFKHVIYSGMKYVWTYYNVNEILVVCHDYDNIFVFGLSGDNLIFALL